MKNRNLLNNSNTTVLTNDSKLNDDYNECVLFSVPFCITYSILDIDTLTVISNTVNLIFPRAEGDGINFPNNYRLSDIRRYKKDDLKNTDSVRKYYLTETPVNEEYRNFIDDKSNHKNIYVNYKQLGNHPIIKHNHNKNDNVVTICEDNSCKKKISVKPFYEKYLKYKTKYLALKKILNN